MTEAKETKAPVESKKVDQEAKHLILFDGRVMDAKTGALVCKMPFADGKREENGMHDTMVADPVSSNLVWYSCAFADEPDRLKVASFLTGQVAAEFDIPGTGKDRIRSTFGVWCGEIVTQIQGYDDKNTPIGMSDLTRWSVQGKQLGTIPCPRDYHIAEFYTVSDQYLYARVLKPPTLLRWKRTTADDTKGKGEPLVIPLKCIYDYREFDHVTILTVHEATNTIYLFNRYSGGVLHKGVIQQDGSVVWTKPFGNAHALTSVNSIELLGPTTTGVVAADSYTYEQGHHMSYVTAGHDDKVVHVRLPMPSTIKDCSIPSYGGRPVWSQGNVYLPLQDKNYKNVGLYKWIVAEDPKAWKLDTAFTPIQGAEHMKASAEIMCAV